MGPSRRFRFPACVIFLASVSACVPRAAAPAPQPVPPSRPAPPPTPPTPPPAPAPVAWQDGPLAAGDWSYSGAGPGSEASFGAPGATLFALRCEAGRQIRILPLGAAGGPIAIVTSFAERILPGAGNDGQAPAALPASDGVFDQIAFSRGRFLVRSAGGGGLVLPSWPEPARLIEDCRG
jgi:hypothetical protein